MYKVDLPVEDSSDAAVERRRAAESARRSRIFNTRSRVIGVDLKTLNEQVEEKRLLQTGERIRDQAYDNMRRSQDEALMEQQREEEEKCSAMKKDLAEYWSTQRAGESFDLGGAPLITIPEAELGLASMMIFEGEAKEFTQAKMQATERNLRAQKEDNERRRMEEKRTEGLIGEEMLNRDLRVVQLRSQEDECKKAVRIALQNYNHALAAEKIEKQREQKLKVEGEDLAEILNMVTSDMLTECPEGSARGAGAGGAGSSRVLVDRWRGMTQEQMRAIHREREEQCLQRQRERDTKRFLDADNDHQYIYMMKEAEREQRRVAALEREGRIQLDQYNRQLARDQRAHKDFLDKQLYTNKPTADYFSQFNTTSR